MVDSVKLVELVNKGCKDLFAKSFTLKPVSGHYNMSLFRNEGTSNALNRFELPSDTVRVINWFDRFWVYLQIKFIANEYVENRKKRKDIHTYISMSIFEGDDNDNQKNQLFRAEWDDYNNSEESHSQPHWHITANQAIEKTFEEYSLLFDNGDFINILQKEKSKLFNVNKIHFAMNGNWQSDETHIHKIDSEEKIVKWLQGMLGHLRVELE